MDRLEKNEYLYDRFLKACSLPFKVKVKGNAAPANKVRSSDLPGVVLIAAEGQTSEVEAVEAATGYATPADATGLYSVMLKGSELGSIKEVYSVSLLRTLDGGTTTATLVGLSAGGNILIDINATDALNSTDDSELYLEVKYCLK